MKSRLPSTSDIKSYSTWVAKQEALIASLEVQPLLIVLRPKHRDLEVSSSCTTLFELIEELHSEGVRHIEIAWSPHPGWASLVQTISKSFKNLSLGAASIKDFAGLKAVAELGLTYAMSPFWNHELQAQAQRLEQVLIPGAFSPSEIQQASCFGCRLIKLFPASTLGIKYLHQLREPIGDLPFIIAAGGLTVSDLTPWLQEGYGAIALGRKLIQEGKLDPKLRSWLKG